MGSIVDFVNAHRVPSSFDSRYFVEAGGCHGCVVRCKRTARSEGPWKVDPAYGGPEYETAGAFGSLCGVADLEAICKAHELCNRYTLDTISTGATIAWAMDSSPTRLTSWSTFSMETRMEALPASACAGRSWLSTRWRACFSARAG